LNRVVKTGVVFGSATSDMAPDLIDRYDLLRGIKKLGTLVGMVGAVFQQRVSTLRCIATTVRCTVGCEHLPPTRAPASGMRTPTVSGTSFFDKVAADD